MTAPAEMRLIDPQGRRLYLTAEERRAFLEAARDARREVRTFCTVLHDTGVRISEALEFSPARINLAAGAITIRSLKNAVRTSTGPFRCRRALSVKWG